MGKRKVTKNVESMLEDYAKIIECAEGMNRGTFRNSLMSVADDVAQEIIGQVTLLEDAYQIREKQND